MEHHCLDCGHTWGTPAAQPPQTPQTPPQAPQTPPQARLSHTTPTDDQTPADWLRNHWDWHTELTNAGWTISRHTGQDTYWTRPGKPTRDGHSAILHGPDGPFVVWTTSAPELAALGKPTADGSGYTVTPFEFFTGMQHGGDFTAATRAIRHQMPAPTTTMTDRLRTPPPPNVDPETGEILEQPDGDNPATTDLELVDWPTFWTQDHDQTDWLIEPLIPAKRGTAIFAPGGTGKSLLALNISAAIATGKTIFNTPTTPTHVLYLDYEMTPADLQERLTTMGYGPHTNLDHLHYALLPNLPPLDTPQGGQAILTIAQQTNAQLVVIDTLSRAVQGDENEAETIRNLYRWTGMHLKADGRAFLRVDHAGKDIEKGQRGTSAKNDDVDVVWQMAARDRDSYRLTAKKRRMSWVPENVVLTIDNTHGLEFNITENATLPEGTVETVNLLDRLNVPTDLSARKAGDALRAAGHGRRDLLVREAVKYRQRRNEGRYLTGDEQYDPLARRDVEPGFQPPHPCG